MLSLLDVKLFIIQLNAYHEGHVSTFRPKVISIRCCPKGQSYVYNITCINMLSEYLHRKAYVGQY